MRDFAGRDPADVALRIGREVASRDLAAMGFELDDIEGTASFEFTTFVTVRGETRSSIIVDPADGRLPVGGQLGEALLDLHVALVAGGQLAERDRGLAAGPVDRDRLEAGLPGLAGVGEQPPAGERPRLQPGHPADHEQGQKGAHEPARPAGRRGGPGGRAGRGRSWRRLVSHGGHATPATGRPRPSPPGGSGGRPGDLGAEDEQVGQPEPSRLGGGEGGPPAGVDGPVGLAVGVDDADQDLAHQPAADRAQALAAAAVLGLLEQVEPERRLQPPAGRPQADLPGGERLDPESLSQVMARYYETMRAVVRHHGGTVEKFAGDAVMAVFGAPKPVADHPERAVRCALAMQRRQAELNAEARTLGLPASEIGIGINTGTVIAGLIGGAGRVDYTVIGDTVNVAQRLQSEAKAGEILASAATVQRCSWPGAQPAGTRLLKGRQQPVEVYRLQPTSQIDV